MSTDTPQLGFWLETEHQAGLRDSCDFGLRGRDSRHGAWGHFIDRGRSSHRFHKSLGLGVFSRVGAAERVPIQQALDAGADGVIIPQIQNAEHARVVSAYAKYPPLGTRGIGFNRTMSYGSTERDFCEAENERTRCYPMIETPGALEEAASIASLDTVEGLFLGPGDLSLTAGRGLNQWTSADIADAERVIECAKKPTKAGPCRPGIKPPLHLPAGTAPLTSPCPTTSAL